MGELVPLPKRQPIDISVPHVECEVNNCTKPCVADMVVFFQRESSLNIFQICAHHVFLWKGFAPALFFPLNQTPSLPWIAKLLQEAMVRRHPPQSVYQPMYHYGGTGTTYTAYTNMTFRFS